ncbi:hypothetical protein [Arcticibacter tournemirensis]|uniref:Uncharacterized protein n=1 Tax=Arcticibacter tournemirensis TaxID=699437 RepID=A0A4Q0M526_9SPHI|nr:hypothetical protein [Arcticibacter tournemirensis]RXF68024.1 hypothetical protein EKH83_17280 [Arcticibacter tournemirensis]
MKRYFLLIFVFISISGYAQNNLNNYRYIIVPKKFSFFKEEDQHKLNTLSKALLEAKGFTVYFDDTELPDDIAANKCKALSYELQERKTMFATNLTFSLKDCKGNVLYKSKEGKSREKDFRASYTLALRDAFEPFNEVQYVYTAPAEATIQPHADAQSAVTPVSTTASSPAIAPSATAETLYAQPTASGYQLIDTTPKVILTLLKTSVEGYFIGNTSASNGIVFKKNDSWFFEYYKNGKLVSETLLIKF